MNLPDHPFWDFSITVHQREGVHEACLALQRTYSLDVNLLFFCCWVGVAGGDPLSRSQVKAAVAAVEGWQDDIVRPIWKARWKLKPSYKNFPTTYTEELRQRLIKAELDAEHMEQLHLGQAVSFSTNPSISDDKKVDNVVSNIFLYLDLFFHKAPIHLRDNNIVTPLLMLVSACFPDQDEERLKKVIKNRLAGTEGVSDHHLPHQ